MTGKSQGNATQSPLPCGGGWGWVVKGTPRACRFSQKQSFKTLAARVIHERNLNAKRFFARAKLPFSFYALFLWQAAAFSSKEKAHGNGRVFVILSVAKNPRKWILRFAQYDKAHGTPLFKSRAHRLSKKGKAPSPPSQTKRAKNEIYTQKKDKL